MWSKIVVVLLFGLIFASPDIDEDILKQDIEEAAEESRALADELAAMLSNLNSENDPNDRRPKNTNDGAEVEDAMQDLAFKIRELAKVSSKSSSLDIPEKVKEKELRTTLAEVELVAKKVEEVQTFEEVDTFEEMVHLLESVSNSIEQKFGGERNRKGKSDQANIAFAKVNEIDDMIRSIEKVTDGLKIMNKKKELENKIRKIPSQRGFRISY